MDRVAWRATVHGVARVGHDLVTKERERALFNHPVLPKTGRREEKNRGTLVKVVV